MSGILSITMRTDSLTTGVEGGLEDGLPRAFALYQNYPNPFNPTTTITYDIPQSSHVTLKVFDLIGREVAMLVNETQEAGTRSVVLNAGKLASGMYLYKLEAGTFSASRKLLLLR